MPQSAAAAEVIVRMWTYRFVVLGSLLSAFLVGLHVPALHEMMEHGAAPHWDVITATLLLVVATLWGTWVLLRSARAFR